MTAPLLPAIAENLARVRERMSRAAEGARRNPEDVILVAVSKTHPWSYVAAALAAGQVDFGENRPEEAYEKFFGSPHPELPVARLHLIGPIQSRKDRLAFDCRPALIHSVDRLKIAHRLNELTQETGQSLDVLFEVNISGEISKSGFSPAELASAAPELLSLPGLRSHGLMAIPPFDPDPETARPHFVALRRLRDALAGAHPQADWSQLSMGMSDDFEVAIAEGATIVRVGSAIFGPRK